MKTFIDACESWQIPVDDQWIGKQIAIHVQFDITKEALVHLFQGLFCLRYFPLKRQAKPSLDRPNAPPGPISCPQFHLQPPRFQKLAAANESGVEKRRELRMH